MAAHCAVNVLLAATPISGPACVYERGVGVRDERGPDTIADAEQRRAARLGDFDGFQDVCGLAALRDRDRERASSTTGCE